MTQIVLKWDGNICNVMDNDVRLEYQPLVYICLFHTHKKSLQENMEFGELVEPDTRAFWDNYDELDIE